VGNFIDGFAIGMFVSCILEIVVCAGKWKMLEKMINSEIKAFREIIELKEKHKTLIDELKDKNE